jgi:hypothetical protein
VTASDGLWAKGRELLQHGAIFAADVTIPLGTHGIGGHPVCVHCGEDEECIQSDPSPSFTMDLACTLPVGVSAETGELMCVAPMDLVQRHEARVTELLETNNRSLARARQAIRDLDDARYERDLWKEKALRFREQLRRVDPAWRDT